MPQPSAAPTPPTTPPDLPATAPTTRGWRRLLLAPAALLGLGWTFVVPMLTLQAVLDTAAFFGEQPDAADRAAQHHDLAVALGVSAAVVVVGLALSVQARSNAAATAFVLLLLPTLVLGLAWVGTVAAPAHPPPEPSVTGQQACQERSGGDTRCPGG